MDVGRPVEVLDKMIDLQRWWESPQAAVVGEAFINDIARKEKYPDFFTPAQVFAKHQAFVLQRSLPYFVTDQMVDKIWEFSKGFETVGFFPEDVPCPYGFMWLAKPVYTLDANGEMQCTRVVTWDQGDNGVALCFYADRHDNFDEVNLKLRKEFDKEFLSRTAELSLNHVQPMAWGDATKFFQGDDEAYARKYKGVMGNAYKPENIRIARDEHFALCRFVLACWEWMGYQLPNRELPHRQLARRLGRSNLDASEVLIIDLQAVEPSHIPPATHQIVKWHYKFRSRPHKRHWVDKHGNQRVTDVVGCIKPQAPEYDDLPLVEKDVLFKMRRGHAPI